MAGEENVPSPATPSLAWHPSAGGHAVTQEHLSSFALLFPPWELSAELGLISLAPSDPRGLSLCLALPPSPVGACTALVGGCGGGRGWAVGGSETPEGLGDMRGGRSALSPGRAMAALWPLWLDRVSPAPRCAHARSDGAPIPTLLVTIAAGAAPSHPETSAPAWARWDALCPADVG